jgi:hypothetical protein
VTDIDEQDYWAEHPDPSDEEIARVCEAWIAYQRRNEHVRGVSEDDPDWWAVMAVIEARTSGGEVEWRIIRDLCARVDAEDLWLVDVIGAGPLEDFLDRHGDEAMDLVEATAKGDPVLMGALAKVWAFDSAVRPRIELYLRSNGLGPAGGFRALK